MATTENTADDTFTLEVSGEQTHLVKDVLKRVRLNSSVTRVRIEIESNGQILAEANSDTTSQESQPQEQDPEREPEEEADDEPPTPEANGSSKANGNGSGGEMVVKSHVTDSLSTSDHADEDKWIVADSARRYIENVGEIDREDFDGDWPDPSFFEAYIDFPEPKPDTQRWYLMGLLYRVNGFLSNAEISGALEDTDWEMPYSSISPVLSVLRDAGLTLKHKELGGHQLTQLGRDYFTSLFYHRPGYHLGVADDIKENLPADKKRVPDHVEVAV